MSSAAGWWIVIIAVGALNFLSRLSFIALFARVDMPSSVERALRYVPAAMLAAIVVPVVVFVAPGAPALTHANPKLIAALVAGAVAWRTKSTVATIGIGMPTLWLARWLLAGPGSG